MKTVALVGAAVLLLAVLIPAPASPEDGDNVPGPIAADQRDATSPPRPPSTPTVVSLSGTAGSYRTSRWDGGFVDASKDLAVTESSAPGTAALTGIVEDAEGYPIPGATVTLSLPGRRWTTTTDEDGAYSFIDILPTTYTFTIGASGYGLFTVTDSAFDPDADYELTSRLRWTPQTYSDADPRRP